MADSYDVVVVGGGIGGGGLATVLARAGLAVLVLEKSTAYRDLVRGEWIAPWGVVEARRTGLYAVLAAAGNGHHLKTHIEYGEGIDPAQAEASAGDLTSFLPGAPGPLSLGHPAACDALATAASESGATIVRGVADVLVNAGRAPTVTYEKDGASHVVRPRLVVAADGRNSTIRGQLGIDLHRAETHHFFSGMLVEDAHAWPEYVQTIGTEGDVQFFAFPQGEGRIRLYMSYGLDQKSRLSGDDGPKRFLETFRLKTIPQADVLAGATIAGPCNSIPNADAWTETPFVPGVVLVGDAAGFNDPITGQGLSITLRDVRIVGELLMGTSDWAGLSFAPYAEERAERMRRLRFCARMDSLVHAEFGAAAQRRRMAIRARRAADPSFMKCQGALMVGPELFPGELFSEQIYAEAAAMGS